MQANKIKYYPSNTEGIEDLIQKASIARKENAELSLVLCKQAAESAKLAGYKKGLAKAYLNSGYSCRLLSEFEAAIEYFDNALPIFRQINDNTGISRTLNGIGNVHLNLSSFDKAIEFYDESIYTLQSIGDLNFETSVLSNRGLAFQQSGNLRASLNNYLESLSISKSTGNPVHYSLFNNLGIVYHETESFYESLMYFNEALKKTMAEKNLIDESFALANIGRTYIYTEDFSNAITYLSEAMIIMKRYGNRQAETQVYANLGKAYMKMRCFPEAIKYYNRALKYYKEIGDKSSVDHTLCELGELYFELNDYRTSKQYFMDGLEVSEKINDVMNIVRINIGLAKLYLKFNDTEKASGYLSIAEKLAESAKSYKDLSKISKIYSEYCRLEGNYREAKQYMDKHYIYLEKLNNLAEANKIQAMMLGHIKEKVSHVEPAYYFNPPKEKVLSKA